MPQQSRREFLQVAGVGAAGLAMGRSAAASAAPARAKSVIFINLVGGPSHLDTFDPKPDAPSDIRGPFRPIRTKVPGLHLTELFPRLAGMADKFTLIRSMHHDAPPIHEAGLQLNNTGRLFRDGPEWPNMGAVIAHLLGEQNQCPPWWHMGSDQIDTGISIGHGLAAGFLPVPDYWPCHPQLKDASFEIVCQCAAAAASSGARYISTNMFNTVFDAPSWDCHADRGSLGTTLDDYRTTVAPSFDGAFSRLLIQLEERGLLESTLVVATGEFGRTPKLNANGGRDHWANCWSALIAGGGVKGGRVLGASDATGGEPAERPVTPQELVSTVFHALGVPKSATIPGPQGSPVPVYPDKPIEELF